MNKDKEMNRDKDMEMDKYKEMDKETESDAVRGIIFDYGGTIDSRGDHWSHIIAQGWQKAGLNVGTEIPADVFSDCYVHAERALAAQRIILPGDDFGVLMLKKMRIEMGRLAQLGYVNPAQTGHAATVAAKYCYDYARECVNAARPVLQALSQKYRLVLVSNFYGNVDEVLRDFDIRRYFDGIIESAVVGVRKPDPRIFMLGVVALGLEPQQVLVVGDSLRKDILPARSIGCKTAWIKGRGWTADEDAAQDPAQIAGLDTLLQMLC